MEIGDFGAARRLLCIVHNRGSKMGEKASRTCRGDTRNFRRIPMGVPASLAVWKPSTASAMTASVFVGDVSHGGLRISSRLAMPAEMVKGASIRIRVALADRLLVLPGEVVWVLPLQGGLWSAGIRIQREVTDETTRESFDGCVAAAAR